MTMYVALTDKYDQMFGAQIPNAPGCLAMGESMDSVSVNVAAALREWMADRIAAGIELPPVRTLSALETDLSLTDDWASKPTILLVPLSLETDRRT